MANPVVHWELATKNPEKVQAFFASLFGWTIQHAPEMQYWMTQGGGEGGIGGGIMAPPHDSGYLTFYVQVDDLQAYLDRAESLGGKTVVPPQEIPGIGSFAHFLDPDGNMIGLFKGQ